MAQPDPYELDCVGFFSIFGDQVGLKNSQTQPNLTHAHP